MKENKYYNNIYICYDLSNNSQTDTTLSFCVKSYIGIYIYYNTYIIPHCMCDTALLEKKTNVFGKAT